MLDERQNERSPSVVTFIPALRQQADRKDPIGVVVVLQAQSDLLQVIDALCPSRCLARRLNGFFDGEHPTRKTPYEHESVMDEIRMARTIYTGNYVIRPECLRYYIPFAPLKLRMAGPVLGRIIRAELG